ncbi:hypothetical protein [Streptomyces shenzhenensis]|uniref:hypothetical protein n=1 Tax=Streptomyces shenzhenensis TaxID=943815 RepID=UPI001F2E8757|nr:hypothetical protein [Streptomyces shenzhenensis]
MTAPDSLPLHALAEDNLAAASPDLLRAMVKTFADALMSYFNSYVWKPALAEAGVIAPLEGGNPNGARVWEPSREHGFHALRHFYASEELEAGESIVSLARWLGHSDPGFTLRKYSHFLPRAGARGSAAIDAIFA